MSVKALEWEVEEERWHSAKTPFNYGYEVRLTDRDAVRWRHGTRSFEPFDGSFEEAKAAAQADYEQRILSALSPQPVTTPVGEDHIINLIESADAISMLIGKVGNYAGKLEYRREKLLELADLLRSRHRTQRNS